MNQGMLKTKDIHSLEPEPKVKARQQIYCVVANALYSPQFPTPRRALFTSSIFSTMEGRGMLL